MTSRPKLRGPRVVLLLLALSVLVLCVLAWLRDEPGTEHLDLSDPSSWHDADLAVVHWSDRFHWCDGRHGHLPSQGPVGACRGTFSNFLGEIVRRGKMPASEDLLIDIVRRSREGKLVGLSAELLGRWSVERSIPSLVDRVTAEVDPRTLESLSWALELLDAKEATSALCKGLDSAGPYRIHAVGALGTPVGEKALRDRLYSENREWARDAIAEALQKPGRRDPIPSPYGR